MTRRRIFYLLALLSAIVYYIFHTGYSSFFILLAVVGFIPVELLASLFVLLSYKIKTSAAVSVLACGDPADIMVHLESKYPICRFKLKWQCQNKFTAEKTKGKVLCNPDDNNSMMLCHTEQNCGVLEFSIHKARMLDIAGIFALPLKPPQPLSLLVNPAPVYLNIDIPEPAQSTAETVSGKKPGYITTPEFTDIREYRQGDSIRDIHWKLSAKINKTIVREKTSHPGTAFNICCGPVSSAQEYCLILGKLCAVADIFLRSEVTFNMLWQAIGEEVQSVLIETPDDFTAFMWGQLSAVYVPQQSELPECEGSLIVIGLEDITVMQAGLVKEVLQ